MEYKKNVRAKMRKVQPEVTEMKSIIALKPILQCQKA